MPQQNWSEIVNLAMGTTTSHNPSSRASEIFVSSEMQRAGLILAPRIFSTGEVTAAIAQDFTLAQIQAAVPSVVWADLSEGSIATLNTVNIPKGAAEPELAYEFINFILSPEIQQQLAEQGVDAPVNTAVALTPEQAALWTYGADVIAGLQRVDYAKLNAAKGGWVDRWNEIFGM